MEPPARRRRGTKILCDKDETSPHHTVISPDLPTETQLPTPTTAIAVRDNNNFTNGRKRKMRTPPSPHDPSNDSSASLEHYHKAMVLSLVSTRVSTSSSRDGTHESRALATRDSLRTRILKIRPNGRHRLPSTMMVLRDDLPLPPPTRVRYTESTTFRTTGPTAFPAAPEDRELYDTDEERTLHAIRCGLPQARARAGLETKQLAPELLERLSDRRSPSSCSTQRALHREIGRWFTSTPDEVNTVHQYSTLIRAGSCQLKQAAWHLMALANVASSSDVHYVTMHMSVGERCTMLARDMHHMFRTIRQIPMFGTLVSRLPCVKACHACQRISSEWGVQEDPSLTHHPFSLLMDALERVAGSIDTFSILTTLPVGTTSRARELELARTVLDAFNDMHILMKEEIADLKTLGRLFKQGAGRAFVQGLRGALT